MMTIDILTLLIVKHQKYNVFGDLAPPQNSNSLMKLRHLYFELETIRSSNVFNDLVPPQNVKSLRRIRNIMFSMIWNSPKLEIIKNNKELL